MKKEQSELNYFGSDLEAMSFAKNQNSWIMSELRPYLNGSICEVGAGIGNFTKSILNENVEALTSFEPSTNMYAVLQEKFKEDPKVTCVNQYLGNGVKDWIGKYDCMAYVNVLEHVEKDSEELEYVHQCLKENGTLFVFVPSLPFLFSDFDKKIGHFRSE